MHLLRRSKSNHRTTPQADHQNHQRSNRGRGVSQGSHRETPKFDGFDDLLEALCDGLT